MGAGTRGGDASSSVETCSSSALKLKSMPRQLAAPVDYVQVHPSI